MSLPPQVWGLFVWAVVLWVAQMLDKLRSDQKLHNAQMVMVYFRALARFLPCGDCMQHFLERLQISFNPMKNIWPENYLQWAIDQRTQISIKHNRPIRSVAECTPDLESNGGYWKKNIWMGLMMMAFSVPHPPTEALQSDFRALLNFFADHYPWNSPATDALARLNSVTPWWTSRQAMINVVWDLAEFESRNQFAWYATQAEWNLDLQSRVDAVIKQLTQRQEKTTTTTTLVAPAVGTTVNKQQHQILDLPTIVSIDTMSNPLNTPPLINIRQELIEKKRKEAASKAAEEHRRLEAAKAVPMYFPAHQPLINEANSYQKDLFPTVKPTDTQNPHNENVLLPEVRVEPQPNPTDSNGQYVLKGTDAAEYQNQQASASRNAANQMMIWFLVIAGIVFFVGFVLFIVVRRLSFPLLNDPTTPSSKQQVVVVGNNDVESLYRAE